MPKPKPVNINDLTKLVTWIDGYSVMSPVDPVRLRKIAEKYPDDRDISTAWKDVEGDIWDIARIPSTSPEIVRSSKILGFLKQMLMFIGFIILAIYLAGSTVGAFTSLGKYSALAFAIIFLVAYIAGFSCYFYLDRRLGGLVSSWYTKHSNDISSQRRHAKQVNQRLIDKVSAEVRARRADPEKYKFTLLQKDYSNIAVKKENNSNYVVTVKGSKRTDDQST